MDIIFMGTPDFAATVLGALQKSRHHVTLVVTQPDKPVGRKKTLTPSPVKKLAMEKGIPVFQPEKIRRDHALVSKMSADLLVTAAYGQMLPKAILDAHKAINVHASLLPAYRGGAPIQYALFDGRQKTGVTIMNMAIKMDSGDILLQKETDIRPEDNHGTLSERLAVLGAEALLETLEMIERGTVRPVPQDERHVTFAPTIKHEDEHLDFSLPARDVVNRIRGLSPEPGGHVNLKDISIKIFGASVLDEAFPTFEPRTVIRADKDLVIKAGDKGVLIHEIQVPGKRRMAVRDFLNGQKLIKSGDKVT
jgi:methionyl-tRNA formyltransferase